MAYLELADDYECSTDAAFAEINLNSDLTVSGLGFLLDGLAMYS